MEQTLEQKWDSGVEEAIEVVKDLPTPQEQVAVLMAAAIKIASEHRKNPYVLDILRTFVGEMQGAL